MLKTARKGTNMTCMLKECVQDVWPLFAAHLTQMTGSSFVAPRHESTTT